jgi:hypothetical protein
MIIKYVLNTKTERRSYSFFNFKIMSDEEILRLLNISTESTFYKKIVRKSKKLSNKSIELLLYLFIQKSNSEIHGHTSLMMSMLTCIASWLPGSSQNSGTQTANDLWAGSIAGSTLGSYSLLFFFE